MTLELTEEQKIKILNSDDVFGVMQEILIREDKIDQEKEHFWMIGLASNNRILFIELVSLGSVTATTVEPMNVFRVAVMKGAVFAIMVHNHPSGEVFPSDADKDLTDRLIQVGRILDIKVLDHLVISTRSFLSFDDIGLMDQLRESTKWVPQYELIERIKAEEKKIREQAVREAEKRGEEKGHREGLAEGEQRGIVKGEEMGVAKGEYAKSLAIARQMKAEGDSVEKISRITGLSAEEVESLS